MNTTPNVKLYRVNEKYYIYDINTNRIISVNREVYSYLYHHVNGKHKSDQFHNDKPDCDNSSEADKKASDEINKLNRKGLLLPSVISKLTYKMTKSELVDVLKDRVEQLCLEITQACNFRCSYCMYSDKFGYNRNHGVDSMSEDTMIRAADFKLSRDGKCKDSVIGFYGGEPLLEMNKIVRLVEYVRQNYGSRNVKWQITTNGYLINEEIADFCAEHDITLWVSFDGSIKTHDLNRKTAGGHKTGKRVFGNIRMLFERHPAYSANRVYINQVLANNHDIVEFVENNVIFNLNQYGFYHFKVNSTSSAPDTDAPGKESLDYFLFNNRTFIQNMIDNEGDPEKKKKGHIVLGRFFDSFLNQLASRRLQCPTSNPPRGMCVPGARKIFVDAHGDIHSCERVNSSYPIGNVHSGFDYDKIYTLMKNFERLNEESCLKCDALRMCNLCIAPIMCEGELSETHLSEWCKKYKREFDHYIRLFSAICEKNPRAFEDYLYNYLRLKACDVIQYEEECCSKDIYKVDDGELLSMCAYIGKGEAGCGR